MNKKLIVSLILIFVFHVVGLIGMKGDHPSFFIRNTPLNLLISVFLLLLNHDSWNKRQVYVLTAIFLGGFLVEVIGTNTGYLFGSYTYGKTLGLKLFNVPVVIGANWMMMIYVSGNLAEQLHIPVYLKAFLAAMLLVLLDFLIEPVAMHFDYWNWENDLIPLTNYLCWFIISFLFLSLFFKVGFKRYNPISGVLYCIQLVMFMVLHAGL